MFCLNKHTLHWISSYSIAESVSKKNYRKQIHSHGAQLDNLNNSFFEIVKFIEPSQICISYCIISRVTSACLIIFTFEIALAERERERRMRKLPTEEEVVEKKTAIIFYCFSRRIVGFS